MAETCKADRRLLAAANSGDPYPGTFVVPDPAPLGHEPDSCQTFLEQFPDHFYRLIGRTIWGSFNLYDEALNEGFRACEGSGGYSDIKAGVRVVVKNGKGNVVGAGTLNQGRLVGDAHCEFRFEVFPVMEADFYEVSVGRRGSLFYARTDMEDNFWTVLFSLGR